MIKALEMIAGGGAVGRIRLSKELGLGEGVTRTLVRHLKNEGIIKISRSGILLSRHGEKLFSDLRSRISQEAEIPPSPLTVGPFNVAVLVRGAASVVKTGLEQRDTAIKAGALGATTLIFSRNRLTMPQAEKGAVFKDIPSIHKTLISRLDPKENDVVIIGSGQNKRLAELGAKMAALGLLTRAPRYKSLRGVE